MKKITVKVNEEFRIKMITDFTQNEFFYNAFVKAKNELECIVKDTTTYHDAPNDTMFDFSNNIIAFSGDRGQGKSSAMLSFSNVLSNCKGSSSKDFLGELLSKNNYIVLDRIDPTKFENNDNILLIILAKIFNKFCDLWKNSDKTNMVQYSNLLEQFQLCYDEIMTIKNIEEHEYAIGNALEKLGRIGDSGNLKKDLWKLLQDFFAFENNCTLKPTNRSNNYLVIQMDDTDLNAEKAYTIVEDIRKYFMIPNVIILMAIDINQLTKAIEQYFISNYERYNKYYANEFVEEHRQIAVKYIDKLIPGDRKIFLPKLTPSSDENAEKLELEYSDGKRNILDFRYNNGDIIKDAQELVLRLIYEKTGIIFVKPKTYIHDIIPKTMRELVNFLSVLNKMPDISNNYNDINDLKIKLENIKSFETFFVNVWIPNYVLHKYSENVDNFISASRVTKNKQFIKDLKVTMKAALIETMDSSDIFLGRNTNARFLSTIRAIEEKGVYSFADIRTILFILEDEFPQEETYKFTFAIKTLYTIYLNKIICNQLMQKNSEEHVDCNLLLDFLGGEIFSEDEVNNFMRTEKNVFNRGAFTIVSTYNTDARNRLQRLLVRKDMSLMSFFINFLFPNAQEKVPIYKIPYKAPNGVSSTYFKYNACDPILKLIYPHFTISRVDNRLPEISINDDFLTFISYQCMQIVSNTDLINYLSKKMQDLSVIKSENWSYSDHLYNLYDRLEKYISELNYYNLFVSFENFKKAIKRNSLVFNELYEIYKELDEEFDAKAIEMREDFSKHIAKLATLRGTRTFEGLKEKVLDLLRTVSSYENSLSGVDLSYYISRLEKLNETLQSRHGLLDSDSRALFQSEYNRIIKDLKKEFEE